MTEQTSVIIACYNDEAYLPEALNSVCQQTQKVREIIVVDDGSKTPIQAPSAWNGPPLRIVRTNNRGVSAARNLGVSLATGAFIAFLDADDAWVPTKIEIQENLLNSNPDVVAVFTHRIEKPGWPSCPPMTYPPPDVSRADFLARLWQWNFITLSSVMVRHQIFRRVGGFKECLRCSEDWELWVRLLTAGRFTQIPLPLCYRRYHSDQMTKNFDQIVVYHRKCRQLLMQEQGERLVAAGVSLRQQRRFAREEYREHLLILYFKRRFATARRLLWDYLLSYPSDLPILKYALLSLLPQWFFVALRDKTDELTKLHTPVASRKD
jgi:glycosyltransferase involved in cell wall biosynthesis